jgi:glycosyltransferase involved in cell wall biosynthesis
MRPVVRSQERFLIVHAGSLSESEDWRRSPEGLFEALQHLCDADAELRRRLTLAFTGRLPQRYRQLVETYGLGDIVEETGHLPREAFGDLLRSADLLLAINYDGAATLIPGKIYEYWMVGQAPILLLSCPGAAESLLVRHGIGTAVEPYDVAGIEHAILQVYRSKLAGHPVRTGTDGIERYERRALTRTLAETLSSLVGDGWAQAQTATALEPAAGRKDL